MIWSIVLLPAGVALAVLIVAWRLLNPPPRLEIGERGILDRELGLGLIPWDEIEGAYPPRPDEADAIRLKLRHTERMAGILRRRARHPAIEIDAAGSVEIRLDLSGTELDPLEALARVLDRDAGRRASDRPLDPRPPGVPGPAE
jgi:hypothetical protein